MNRQPEAARPDTVDVAVVVCPANNPAARCCFKPSAMAVKNPRGSGSSVLKQRCAESESMTIIASPMIACDGGGRRPSRQAALRGRRNWADINVEAPATNIGRRSACRGCISLTCDGDHSPRPRYRVIPNRSGGLSRRTERKRSPDRQTAIFHSGHNLARPRPRGWVRSAAPAWISHCAGRRARRLRYFRGLGRRARELQPSPNGHETPCVHDHGCAGSLACRRSACSALRWKPRARAPSARSALPVCPRQTRFGEARPGCGPP